MHIKYQVSESLSARWLASHLAHLIFPNILKQAQRYNQHFTGIIATLNKVVIGLILTTADVDGKVYRIHSLKVMEQYRGKKIGFTLVRELEKFLQKRSVTRLEGTYRSHWQSVHLIEKILQKLAWQLPTPHLLLLKGSIVKAMNYIPESRAFSNNLSFLSFTQLKKSYINYIKKEIECKNWFDRDLSPFLSMQTIDRDSSIMVLEKELPIGWIVTHRIQNHTNEITALFLHPEKRKFSLGYTLIRKCLESCKNNEINNFIVTSKANGNPIVSLLSKHLANTDFQIIIEYYSYKSW